MGQLVNFLQGHVSRIGLEGPPRVEEVDPGPVSHIWLSSNGPWMLGHPGKLPGHIGQQEPPEGQQGTEALPRDLPLLGPSFPGPS